jgi:hypothetical protein
MKVRKINIKEQLIILVECFTIDQFFACKRRNLRFRWPISWSFCEIRFTVSYETLTKTTTLTQQKHITVLTEAEYNSISGEMGCGYADGALTAEQTMKLAYHRGTSIMNSKLGIKVCFYIVIFVNS